MIILEQTIVTNEEKPVIANMSSVHSSIATGKKKRTTSSSSTSSSSSRTSLTSSNPIKRDEQSSFSHCRVPLPVLSSSINFFSSSVAEQEQSSGSKSRRSNKIHLASFHHHHPKVKKSFNRHLYKFDRRREASEHFDETNLQSKNLQHLNKSNSTGYKSSMRINTDTKKALEHLRELASNPSTLERIQTLANHPNLIQEIKKIANQSFTEQLRTLPPFTPANLVEPLDSRPTKVERSTTTSTVQKLSQIQEKSQLRTTNRIDVNCQTESNHDTALTLSCVGGHEDLIVLLLQRGANIEHRDKKGFTPLILAGISKIGFYF